MTDTAQAASPPVAPAPPARTPLFSQGYTTLVLVFLLLAYTFNFIDRTIIATIGQAIKVDLKITDTQLGLLGGLSFAVLYTLLGIPIARLAERWNRVSIISLALVVWSGFTVACGFAGNFVSLLAMRVGVGVGEAGCSPPSHSLISDYFEPKRRASALSIYAFGIPLGSMIGAVAGGWLAKTYGWRVAFMVVGAPGVVLALLVKLLVKEPPRGHSDPVERPALPEDVPAEAASAPAGGHWLWTEIKELSAVTRDLFSHWPVLNMVLGVTLTSVAGYGVGQFSSPYFIRTFALDYATVGLVFGLVGGFSSGLGTLAGGFVSDWASKRDARWYALTPAIGLAIATPIYIFAYRQPDWRVAAAILLLPGVFHYTYLGPTFGVVQNVVETRRRATATAVLFLFLNIIALGGGPLFTGWLIDQFAQFDFTHGERHILPALRGMAAGGPASEHFAALCPGGVAPKGAPAAAGARCREALVAATRQGIVFTIGFYAWGGFHYLLASFGIARRLAVVAAERKARET
jgi:predicted MFS family arabinose efflux permease